MFASQKYPKNNEKTAGGRLRAPQNLFKNVFYLFFCCHISYILAFMRGHLQTKLFSTIKSQKENNWKFSLGEGGLKIPFLGFFNKKLKLFSTIKSQKEKNWKFSLEEGGKLNIPFQGFVNKKIKLNPYFFALFLAKIENLRIYSKTNIKFALYKWICLS